MSRHSLLKLGAVQNNSSICGLWLCRDQGVCFRQLKSPSSQRWLMLSWRWPCQKHSFQVFGTSSLLSQNHTKKGTGDIQGCRGASLKSAGLNPCRWACSSCDSRTGTWAWSFTACFCSIPVVALLLLLSELMQTLIASVCYGYIWQATIWVGGLLRFSWVSEMSLSVGSGPVTRTVTWFGYCVVTLQKSD